MTPNGDGSQLDCRCCGARLTLVIDFIVRACRFVCPQGCDGNGWWR